MWSAPDGSRDRAGDQRLPQRGEVWLAASPPARTRDLVVIVGANFPSSSGRPILAAPLLPSGAAGPGRVTVGEAHGLHAPATLDAAALVALDPANLVMAIASLSDAGLATLDSALRDVLGIPAPAPVQPALMNGDAQEVVAETVFDVFPPAPPPPPPLTDMGIHPFHAAPLPMDPARGEPPDSVASDAYADDRTPTSAQPDWLWSADDAGFDDHPIAQIFGRPQHRLGEGSRDVLPPTSPSPPAAELPGAAFAAASNRGTSASLPVHLRDAPIESPTRAAAVMPELLEIVRRRLQRNAPRLEGVLQQAADEGRSVEWAAAAVRHTGVRGVVQTTLDEIADEMSAAGARYSATP